DYEASFREARTATQGRSELPEGLMILAAAASALGKIEEAQRAVRQCVTRWPGICLGNVMPIYVPRYEHEDDRQRLLAMLRKAGLPE
ncbi:MAG TPA: transcriptional regulator, partial [Bradyrhizobium sp.]|nr:transcriptional regulator [Bradyrhizobium sp.]